MPCCSVGGSQSAAILIPRTIANPKLLSRALRQLPHSRFSRRNRPEIADFRGFPSRSRRFDRRGSRLGDDLRIRRAGLPPEFGGVSAQPQVRDVDDPEGVGERGL